MTATFAACVAAASYSRTKSSASMAAVDSAGKSRLDIAKAEVGKLIDSMLPDQRLCLISVAGTARQLTDFTDNRRVLRDALEQASKDCWSLFGLRGYARVDFRVDAEGRPFILEINPNPCLEPNAGVAAACAQAGLSYVQLIDDIVHAALQG